MHADRLLAERHVRLRQAGRSAEAAKALWPEFGETLLRVDGCTAVFAGDGSPVTQVNGFGFFEAPQQTTLDAICDFYRGRTHAIEVVMNPFVEPGAWNLLFEQGAKLQSFESVQFLPLLPQNAFGQSEIRNPKSEIVAVSEKEMPDWSVVATRGFFGDDPPPFAADLQRLMEAISGTRRYLAFADGKPAGAAALIEHEGAAFLGGAAVLPEFRGRGLHKALIARRLSDAAANCDVAFIEALPGSTSQTNAEKLGFRLAFQQASLIMPVDPR